MWKRGSHPEGPAILIAHRGGVSETAPDPVHGVRRLIAAGAPMVEFDVRATGDGVLVIHHDPSIDGELLRSKPYRQLMRGHRLVTLTDFLDAADGRIALDIELKEPGYEARVLDAVLERTDPDRVVVTSFEAASLIAARAAAPHVSTGLLVGRRVGWRTPLYAVLDIFPFRRLDHAGADFLAPSQALLKTGLRRRARRRGVRLLVWTVNDPARIARLRADPQVLGVITDWTAVPPAAQP